MNKWQKAYLRGAYRGKSPGALYRERLGTVQDALDWIDDGDCLTWSTHGSEPKVFLEHLLSGVKPKEVGFHLYCR